jgi:hypothetical protein
VAVLFGGGAITVWQTAVAPGSRFPILAVYVFGLVGAAGLYMCFATLWGWWPARRSSAGASAYPPAVQSPGKGEEAAAVVVKDSRPMPNDQDRSSASYQAHSASSLSFPSLEFIGRYDDLSRLLEALRNPQIPLIALKGMGGIGKTALAQEAVERMAAEDFFVRTVWRSTQTERFAGENVVGSEVTDYSFDALLADILVQSDMASSAGAVTGAKLVAVRDLLSASRILIVLDNFETVPNRDAVIASLFEMLGKSKVLITSRYAIAHQGTFSIDLGGLSYEDGVTFLKMIANRQNNQNLIGASKATLTRIYDVTGGAPLAMMLISGQMYYQPVNSILRVIEEAGITKLSYEFYSFIFRRCWSDLDSQSRKVLVAMRRFLGAPTADALRHTVDMSENIFYSAATVLVQRSLLSVEVDSQEARYSLHPLTRYFINTDIAAGWD